MQANAAKYKDRPDQVGWWVDTVSSALKQVLNYADMGACVEAAGRYYGPIELPARQQSIEVERKDAAVVPIEYNSDDKTVIIAHGCNAKGRWGAGFSGVISRRYPEVETLYRRWAYGGPDRPPGEVPMELGRVQAVSVKTAMRCRVYVANMITQQDIRKHPGERVFNPEALRRCLAGLAEIAAELEADVVIMPQIGCGLGGATWEEVCPIMLELCARGIKVRVFNPLP